MDIAMVAHRLKDKGMRPTDQRLSVYTNLLARTDHPTVEMIYNDLAPQHPSLSKTTVYNVLGALVDNGLVKLVTIDSAQARYDADTSLHGHFYCAGCGRVSDFEVESMTLPKDALKGYRIDSQDVYLAGHCPSCASPAMEMEGL